MVEMNVNLDDLKLEDFDYDSVKIPDGLKKT
jgi:hypothetical protein